MNREPDGREASAAGGGELEPFLREAPEIVRGLERNIERLGDTQKDTQKDVQEGVGREDERDEALAALALLCHRLYGSASLYGLSDVATLAAAMESAVAGAAAAEPGGAGDPETAHRVLADAVAAVDAALGAVRRGGAARPGGGEPPAPASRDLLDRLAALAGAGSPADGDPLVARLRHQAMSNPDVLEFFEPEAREHLDGIASALAALASGHGKPALETAFRLVHTLKGAAFMVECEPIGELAHAMEDLLEPARTGRLALDGEPLAALEDAYDVLLGMVAALGGRRAPSAALDREVRARLARCTEPEAVDTEPADTAAGEASEAGEVGEVAAGEDAQRQIRVGLERIDALGELVGEAMISRGRLEHLVERLAEVERQYAVSRGRMADTAEAFERRHLTPRIGGDRVEGAGGGEEAGGDGRWAEAAEVSLDGFSELELDRYDEIDVLMRQIAEISFDLGETQSLLSALSREMTAEIERSTRLLRELRSSVEKTRMLPLGRMLERFRRRVERAAADADKEARLEISGGEVEVDTAIVERLADPLLHLVNNALFHGIETAAERRAAGKPEQGTIALHAAVRGAFVEIEVEDDGRGLDPAALRHRAVELGLGSEIEAQNRSESEARELIFERGFSTAPRLSGAAGRGIGMDVVRSALRRLNGEIRTESLAGRGTRFTLRLPATLVVSTALKLRVGDEELALPTVNVRRVRQVETSRLTVRDGEEWLSLEEQEKDEEEVQVIRLARRLGLAPAPPRSHLPLAMVQVPGRTVALAVDELIGIEEVVVQPLGGFLEGLVGFAGVTLNPDGSVVLVLDPAQLTELTPVAAAHRPADDAARRAARATVARPRVLLADDSISVRKVLARQLGAAGYEVVTAQDGEQALGELRESRFDALITDIEMPRLNGFELLELVRRRPADRDLPTIVVTTRTGGKHRELAERLGATAYFSKPIDRHALLDTLAEVTSPRSTPASPTTGDAVGSGREAS